MSEQTKQCPYCAETIKVDAIVCRFCNRDLVENNTPTRAPDIQKPRKKKPAKNVIIAVIASLIIVCCGLSVATFGTDTDKTVPSSSDSTNSDSVSSENLGQGEDVSVEPSPVATLLPLAPPIEEILATVEGMTDAQRNNYNDQLKGNIVENWTGTIIDVDEGEIFGGFTVYVDMVEDTFGSEVHIKVTEEVALSLNKGQKIIFSGEIKSVSDIMGTTVFIENAIIEPIE